MNVRAVQWMAAACAALGACVKVPAFQYQDAGGDGSGEDAPGDGGSSEVGAVLTTTGGEYTVSLGNLYSMHFATTGYHFPDTLTIGGRQVLGPKATIGCNVEEGVGVTFYPAAVFTSVTNSNLTPTSNTISTMIEGPGIVKVALDWAGNYQKSGCTDSPHGRTTFTFFPDGRIARMDLAKTDATDDPLNCRCSGASTTWEIATYMTFLKSADTQLSGAAMPTSDGENQPVSDGLYGSVCLSGTNPSPYAAAFTWQSSRPGRVRQITSTSLAVLNDMMAPVNGTLPAQNLEDFTLMWIASNNDCLALRPRVEATAVDVQLTINGVPIGAAQDGIYGGETSGSMGNYGFASSSRPFTVTAPVNTPVGPFALWLELANTPTITSVSKPYVAYPVVGHATQKVLWFPDGLGANETITITTSS